MKFTEKELREMGNHNYSAKNYSVKMGQSSIQLRIIGMITGCGIAQMYGVGYFYNAKTKKDIEQLKDSLKPIFAEWGRDVGIILCTLPPSNFNTTEPILLELGFTLLSEYVNHTHDNYTEYGGKGTYKQRLYGIIL